jgi:hypothetical protein
MENVEFEEKVDLDTLVLASKPVRLAEIEINDIKQEPIEEEKQHTAFESDHDVQKEFKLKMEENILRMYQELDKEKSEGSSLDFSLRRSLKIRKFVEKIAAEYVSVDHQMTYEIISLKAKIVEVTEEHKTTMSLNAKTMNSIVKMNEKAQEALDDKSNELANIEQELQSVKVTNQELLQKIQVLEMNKNEFANNDSFEGNHEIKPFSCKYCDKSFHQVHEVKEHIKIHDSISEVEDETTFLKIDKDCVTDDNSNTVDIFRENLGVKNENKSRVPPKMKHEKPTCGAKKVKTPSKIETPVEKPTKGKRKASSEPKEESPATKSFL